MHDLWGSMSQEQNKPTSPMHKAVAIMKDRSQEETEKSDTANAETQASSETEAAGIDDRVQAHLGRLLRAQYQVLLDEPVPDKLKLALDLLARKELKH